MNLRDLQYIIALSEHGHFGKAAAACNVSQPTLSGQIAKLEEELGIAVFHRVGRSVRPTEAGEEIIEHARRAVSASQDIVDIARANRDPLSGRLRLGVIPTLGPYLMPYVLPAAAEKLPNAPLVIVEDLTGNLVPLVAQGKLDAAIIATPPEPAELTSMELFDEPFWVATPANHPLLALKTVSASDIDPKSLLLLADGHCLRDQVVDLCRQQEASIAGHADIRATSLETLLHLTGAGFGVTLVPQMAIESGRASGVQMSIRPLAGDDATRRIRLIYRRNSPRLKALVELARLIRAALPEPMRKLQK
ncbi:MAG: LysR family transcriptional regulator [Rhizobiales bacterium 62-17]|nr:LysR family transcriptional regulator [Hyphomicrobiales bacterium]OJY05818.1 MAG: LysR family transcriptional regulator [Rhizobiales bacterium 62-17]